MPWTAGVHRFATTWLNNLLVRPNLSNKQHGSVFAGSEMVWHNLGWGPRHWWWAWTLSPVRAHRGHNSTAESCRTFFEAIVSSFHIVQTFERLEFTKSSWRSWWRMGMPTDASYLLRLSSSSSHHKTVTLFAACSKNCRIQRNWTRWGLKLSGMTRQSKMHLKGLQ